MPLRSPPRFAALGDTEIERQAVWHQHGLLGQLASYINTYKASLLLIDKSDASTQELTVKRRRAAIGDLIRSGCRDDLDLIAEEMSLAAEWRRMAARDAVMTIFHFGKTLDAIGFKDAPSLARSVDGKRLSRARTRFQQSFRHNEQARHAVGHAGERHLTKESTEQITHVGAIETPNIHIAEGASYVLSNLTEGERMISTVAHPHTGETSVVSVPISQNALLELDEIVSEVFSAFKGAEDAWMRQIESRLPGLSSKTERQDEG